MRVVALIMTAIMLLAPSTPNAIAQAGVDYCQYGHQSSLFLIDRTTRYDSTDQRVIVDSLSAVIDQLGPGDRIVVATIGAHYSLSQRLFNECRPGCPPTNNPFGELATGCATILAQSNRQGFMARLRQAILPVLRTATEAPNSDITGTISQSLREPPAGRPFAKVFIYSDMLENSQALPWRRFLADQPDQSMAVVRHYNLVPAVHAANVRIVGFGRLHDAARTPLSADVDLRVREFWRQYFVAGQAGSVTFEGEIG